MAYVTDIGIDLGSYNIVIYTRGKGIVIKEPAIIAYDRDAESIKAFGEEARQMIGRTPGNISGIRPLKNGVISDYVMIEELLKFFIRKAIGRRGFMKPRIVITVPTQATEVEKRAIEDAGYLAGAREVTLVAKPLASAIGSGIDASKPFGTLIVDIGGGISDIAIVSLGGIVVSSCSQIAGGYFTESIIRYLRKTHLMFVGEQTAEAAKIRIASVSKTNQNKSMKISGRNVFTGLASSIIISTDDLISPIVQSAEELASAICGVLEQATPELANDIFKRGIILTGGGAFLNGLDDVVKKKTGIETIVSERADCTAALGAGQYLEFISKYE